MSKWVYEIILENLPPFSWLPRGYNVLLQMILMETVGISLAILLSLQPYSILLGSLAVFVVSLWSFLIYHIGVTIHRLKPPSAPLEKKVMEHYQESLFNRRHYELYMGFAVFAILLLYLSLFGQGLIRYWLGGQLSPAPLFLAGLILWDLSYRLGVGLWSAVIAFRRSTNFRVVSGMRTKMRYTAYQELKTLKRMDSLNLAFGLVTLLLYPLFTTDIPLFAGLIAYSFAILLFSVASLIVMASIPGLPGEVLWLLDEGKIAYVGTSDKNRQPHLTPVIFVFVANSLFFITSKISKKLKNIRENERIAFLIDLRDENNLYNNRAILFTGKAKVYNIFDAALGVIKLFRVRRAFFKKYPEYMHAYRKEKQNVPLAWRTTIFVSRIPVEVETERIVYWREARAMRLPLGE
jgi:nitroimidazol reductase NimA-like FMN-containing flavoprotein (pyridoxamine 5'-phosphate oxidase superfamily)